MKRIQRLRPGDSVTPRILRAVSSESLSIPDSSHLIHLQFRRFAGCPICKLHLRSFAQRHNELLEAGIREMAVFHSSAESILRHDGHLPFPVIADPDKHLYNEFGLEKSIRSILDPRTWSVIVRGLAIFGPGPPEKGESGLGLPGDFLISPDMRIVACKYGVHADDHWSVDEVLQLSKLAGAPGQHATELIAQYPETLTYGKISK